MDEFWAITGIWTAGIVVMLGVLFCGLLLWTRKRNPFGLQRRSGVILVWIVAVTIGSWLLFRRADAQAAVLHQQNIGIPIIYFYFWLLAMVPAPLLGFALSRLSRDRTS
jgi:hypothetical protein